MSFIRRSAQALKDRSLQLRQKLLQLRAYVFKRQRILCNFYPHCLRKAVALNRQFARESVIHNHTKRIDVASHIDIAGSALLGTHVKRTATNLANTSKLLRTFHQFRNTKIQYFCGFASSLADYHHVLRFDIAVNHALRMCTTHSIGYLNEQLGGTQRLQHLFCKKDFFEVLSIKQFHHDIWLPLFGKTEIKSLDDVVVSERTQHFRFALHALHARFIVRQFCRQKLDCHFTADRRLFCTEYCSHAAFGDQSNNFVIAKASAYQRIGLTFIFSSR